MLPRSARRPVGRRARSTRAALACTLAVATGVARGSTYAALIGGGLSVAVLALRGLRWLVRLRSPQCGARRHVRFLDRRWLVCRHRYAVGCSLYAGCAGFYAGDRHVVARTPLCTRTTGVASVNQQEAAAVVAARLTFPDVMYRRKVLHLIDNTVALSKSVHGYANEPDDRRWLNSRTRRSCSRARARSPMAWLPTGSAVTFSSLRLDRWTSVMHDGQPPHSNASP